ncbi:FxsB family cyclophane-forming radical SAM/SPASM peptide maturase [Nonomuraea sp. NPDC059194]|uniref:FxsB family cyclophane-forming radical SAM/SPASM peptide maturase n=1 Tax=Nonomuraea sp. NPDC059194 TaxID=3346764 RepID=UPI0036736E5E
MVPFRQFVIKVHSRCDLACDHCYVYEHADQSWRRRPKVMSRETIAWTALRIAEHVKSHALDQVTVVLHGGEPLLAGPDRLRAVIEAIEAALAGACRLDLRIHTNGLLLDDDFLDLFEEKGVKVGVSLDGDRAAHDRHRRYADGRGSHARVLGSLALLRRRPHLYAGLLCTVDVANDPIAVYEALVEQAPPRVDFLLKHATWDEPPDSGVGDWLTAVFDRWVADGRPMAVRLFDSIESTSRGGPSLTEALGLEPSDLVVIETDGAYEQVDSLKAAYDGAPETGLDVFGQPLDEVARHPGIVARQRGIDGLAESCRRCPVVDSCGGGLYPHRYREGSFVNPSVYCADLLKLITHVRARAGGRRSRTDEEASTGARLRRTHALTSGQLGELAAGHGSAEAVAALAAGQASLRRLALTRAAAPGPAWRLLTGLDEEHPAALGAVLDHPYVRAWAVGRIAGTVGPAHLGNLAAAAAVRAGITAEVEVEVRDGIACLPGLGALTGMSDALVRVAGGGAEAEGATWEPLRRLTAEGVDVALEDLDPYRDCHQWTPASRLTGEQAAAWQERFAAAVEVIGREHPAYLPAIRAGLTTLTPLDPAAGTTSSAARQAFGAIATTLPPDPETLALLLMHEFQHVKLGGVLDLFDLFDDRDTRLFYAPWRDDPRPLEGLLQGAYAHLAVTDFWRGRDPLAFARWRADTAMAVETLLGAGTLTPLGAAFVAGMRAAVIPWLDEPVPEEAERAAQAARAAHRSRYG